MDDEALIAPDLVLEVHRRGSSTVVGLTGELDASTAPEFADLCLSVHAQGTREIVLDLTRTSFLDSSGLRVLVGAQQLFGDNGGTVRLSHPSEPVMRLLEITGLDEFFSIDEPRAD